MTVKDFIEKFSHNNIIYLENKDNYRIDIEYPERGIEDYCKDWIVEYTDIADCDFICIKQVLREVDEKHWKETMTFKIDTDLKKARILPFKCENAPL